MLNRLPLVLAAALLSLSACKKEKNPLDGLPEATQTGAGTVGWLQDGKTYQPTTYTFSSRAVIVTRFSNGEMGFYFAHKKGQLNRYMIFKVRPLRAPGRYVFDQVGRPSFPNTTPDYASFTTYTPELKGTYLTGPAATGHLLITRLDTVAKIVSGTFEFTAQKVQGEGPETVQITDGRFDVQYEP